MMLMPDYIELYCSTGIVLNFASFILLSFFRLRVLLNTFAKIDQLEGRASLLDFMRNHKAIKNKEHPATTVLLTLFIPFHAVMCLLVYCFTLLFSKKNKTKEVIMIAEFTYYRLQLFCTRKEA